MASNDPTVAYVRQTFHEALASLTPTQKWALGLKAAARQMTAFRGGDMAQQLEAQFERLAASITPPRHSDVVVLLADDPTPAPLAPAALLSDAA